MNEIHTGFSIDTSLGTPRSIYSAAGHFETAALRLVEGLTSEPGLILPWGVMSAFSVELYLKSLILIEKGDPGKIHDLWELFQKLHSDTRSDLSDAYDTKIRNCDIGHFRISKGHYIDLENDLKMSAKAFAEMRYFSQGKTSETKFSVGLLGLVIRNHVHALHPEW